MEYKVVQYTKEIEIKKNGGQLQDVEVAEELSVIPEGALHKEVHHLDEQLEKGKITRKGIPVVTINGDANTFEEIQAKQATLVQHCEIEESEVIFSKELTDFIESSRQHWHETNDPSILEEVGKRVTKELLFNTDDNTGLINTLQTNGD